MARVPLSVKYRNKNILMHPTTERFQASAQTHPSFVAIRPSKTTWKFQSPSFGLARSIATNMSPMDSSAIFPRPASWMMF